MKEQQENKLTLILLIMSLSLAVGSCTMYRDMQALKTPKYEVAEYKGADFCSKCHKEIYNQWSNNSRHATATTSASFHELKGKFNNDFMLNMMMGEDMCYSCHGSKKVNEGVNCETCHGSADSSAEIEEIHRIKFKPGLKDLRRSDFCAGCHEMKNPMTGAVLLSLYSEWQRSPAALEGRECQDCHMQPQKNGFSYHGFDSGRRNVDIYRDDLVIKDINLDFPQLSLAIKNRVTGHAIPTGCATRILVLNIDFFDYQGKKVHTTIETFSKKVTLMRKLMPMKIVENTQLQAGETRALNFSLPLSLQGKIQNMTISLRFYEVPDEYLGDLKKANWISEPFFKKEIVIN